ncbi:hypothetical protein FB451DRAFT_1192914, partial [Mycena latifolia]
MARFKVPAAKIQIRHEGSSSRKLWNLLILPRELNLNRSSMKKRNEARISLRGANQQNPLTTFTSPPSARLDFFARRANAWLEAGSIRAHSTDGAQSLNLQLKSRSTAAAIQIQLRSGLNIQLQFELVKVQGLVTGT